MLFVKSDKLKVGMRLARPIYNRNGVLLYERNSKLTSQGIVSVNNFGLIGVYVLEPAEPVPPMSEDDIEFERFQTMCVFAIKEVLNSIIETKKAPKMYTIATNIIKSYGKLDRKINFIQNLRSKEDYVYKHSLNVAILGAMISNTMHLKADEQFDIVTAAIVHDIGKLVYDKSINQKGISEEEERERSRKAEIAGFDIISDVISPNPSLKRICVQSQKILSDFEKEILDLHVKPSIGTKIMMVAETFDMMTAMNYKQEPSSEVAAIRFLLDNEQVFDPRVVEALIQSIYLLSPGTCIELNSNAKGLVLTSNETDFLKPMVLMFADNKVIDLANEKSCGNLEIKDIMKTLDNRYIMDTELLQKHGYKVEHAEVMGIVTEAEVKGKNDDEDIDEYIPGQDF